MKKKTKTVIGVILAVALVAVLVVVGFMTTWELPGQTIMNSENMSARKVLGE